MDCHYFGDSARLVSEDSIISNNGYGVLMSATDTCTSELVLSGNVISSNDVGVYFAASATPPAVYTRTNNTFVNNASDVDGVPARALTPLAAQ